MKILLVSAAYPPYISGVSTSTANLANYICQKHEVSVVTGSNYKKPHTKKINNNLNLYLFPGVQIKRQKMSLTIPYPYPKKIQDLIERIRPDIIHLQDFGPISFSVLALARKLHIPVMATHHFTAEFVFKTLIPDSTLSNILSSSHLTQQLIYRLVNLFYNRCDLVTVPNPNLIPYFKKAGLKTPIVAVSNGIKVASFRRRAKLKYVLAKYQIRQPQIILFVGRLEPDKNIDILIDAFSLVHRYNPLVSLVLVGDGNRKHQLANQVKKLKIKDAVYFLNKIDNRDAELSYLYNAATIFASASIIETQGVTFIEAITAGLPLVYAKTPLMNNSPFKGVEFESGNAAAMAVGLQKILLDHRLRKSLSRENRRMSRQFDISTTSQQYLDAYQGLQK